MLKVKDELVDDLQRHLRNINEARGYINNLRGLFFKGTDTLHKTQLLVTKERAEYKSEEDERKTSSELLVRVGRALNERGVPGQPT